MVTDTWVSMGQEAEAAKRIKDYEGYQARWRVGLFVRVELQMPRVRALRLVHESATDSVTNEAIDQRQDRAFGSRFGTQFDLNNTQTVLVRRLGALSLSLLRPPPLPQAAVAICARDKLSGESQVQALDRPTVNHVWRCLPSSTATVL